MDKKLKNNILSIVKEIPKQPMDVQITIHLENLKAHFGEENVKNFLKEFYFKPLKRKAG